MRSDHVAERKALVRLQSRDGRAVTLPNGVMTIDGMRQGPASHAADQSVMRILPRSEAIERSFEGLRVLDLGVIVVGAEASRLLADGGADVVKVESRSFPDGNRQSYLPYGLSVSFATGHRNKRSIGVDLRSPEGRALFLKLAATADIILSNFKPGTLETLGIGYEEIVKVRPDVIMVDSSAFGSDGPWSKRLGYGPLVRASTGLTELWRYPDMPESFSDSVTIYPDHAAGRISAIGVVALLIRRLRTARGGVASIAQAEVMLAHSAANVARTALGERAARIRDVPWGVFAAAGDDNFVVITVRDDADWRALADAIGQEEWLADPRLATPDGRRAQRRRIEDAIAHWCAPRDAADVAELLQTRGVPAAPMLRIGDMLDFDYYEDRGLFRIEMHPYLDEEIVSERYQYRSDRQLEPPGRPAPLAGEHSLEIVQEWIGLDADEASALAEGGVIEPTPSAVYEVIEKARSTYKDA
jgi:crotonobetainyl-CoA:carnitine CoA-transferase CaiB-like acyl-CoA transferase